MIRVEGVGLGVWGLGCEGLGGRCYDSGLMDEGVSVCGVLHLWLIV
jgi:hypothetical protein